MAPGEGSEPSEQEVALTVRTSYPKLLRIRTSLGSGCGSSSSRITKGKAEAMAGDGGRGRHDAEPPALK